MACEYCGTSQVTVTLPRHLAEALGLIEPRPKP